MKVAETGIPDLAHDSVDNVFGFLETDTAIQFQAAFDRLDSRLRYPRAELVIRPGIRGSMPWTRSFRAKMRLICRYRNRFRASSVAMILM